jgi:hypothetical protein
MKAVIKIKKLSGMKRPTEQQQAIAVLSTLALILLELITHDRK